MTDRLTQLQICLDQLLEQFSATLNYVDTHHGFVKGMPNEEQMTDLQATIDSKEEYSSTINELSTDIILKTRQVLKLIDSLPGVGVKESEQLDKIQALEEELAVLQDSKLAAVKDKDELLKFVEQLLLQFSTGIINVTDTP